MLNKTKNSRSTVGAAERDKLGANLTGQVPKIDCNTSGAEKPEKDGGTG